MPIAATAHATSTAPPAAFFARAGLAESVRPDLDALVTFPEPVAA
ncbi:hypothetical protein [Nocardia amamiensis]|nr:hypothetical protein [Nocardia amamiensis]